MDDEDGKNADEDVVAEAVEAVEGVEWPDYPIPVGIEKRDVLLEDGLVFVLASPVSLLGAVRGFERRGFVCSGDS